MSDVEKVRVKIVSMKYTPRGEWKGLTEGLVGEVSQCDWDTKGIIPYIRINFSNTFWNVSPKDLMLVSDSVPMTKDYLEYTPDDAKVEETKQINKDEKTSGIKFDSDKLEYSLLPPNTVDDVVKVLGFGAKKYSKDNWMKVDNARERYYNAMMRHIQQWWGGEKYDQETGENHLAHAVCCALFLMWFDKEETKESKE